MEFVVASWNIAGARPMLSRVAFDYASEDLGYFIDELDRIKPDVVCLQETHSNEDRSIAKEIAELLGEFTCEEVRMSPSHIDPQFSLGNAVLSRDTPKASEIVLYPYPMFPLVLPDGRPDAHHEKGFQKLRFEWGTLLNTQMQPLNFLGTPYDSLRGREYAGEMERTLTPHATPPLILCGDLNYGNAKELYSTLLRDFKDALPDTPTKPNNKKTDYIFYSPEFTLRDSGVIETKTDHYLCWAKFFI